MSKVEELIKGYGPKFIGLEQLFKAHPDEAERLRLDSPIPALGRYLKNVSFLHDITSSRGLGIRRFYVALEYLLQLCTLMENYQGRYKHQKIARALSPDDITNIVAMMWRLNTDDVFRAEIMELVSEHDTAAATDYIKILIGKYFPHLDWLIEAVHFGKTSEDNMSNVFGMIGNEIVYGRFIPSLMELMEDILAYATAHDTLLPALTHRQPAEPSVLSKKFLNRLNAMCWLLDQIYKPNGTFQPFSGKMTGATGNFIAHYAAYPDIDWPEFGKKFVESFGLENSQMTDQCSSYVIEAHIFTTISHILTQVIKFSNDFVGYAAAPAQFLVKEKKAGSKGSSIMPKSNAWLNEGGSRMLVKARENLILMANELPSYPFEGDMGRSFLFRDIGDAFMPIFIAFSRIRSEIMKYVPNPPKISAFFDEYPGMAGSALQTVLKRAGAPGDAYRIIQDIAINPDGTYARAEEFKKGLEKKMDQMNLSQELREELVSLLDPNKLVKPVLEIMDANWKKVSHKIGLYRKAAMKTLRYNPKFFNH